MREVLTFGRYLRGKYSQNIRKVPISISGFTCPNIDGTKAKGGCTYCENESFSPNLKNRQKETPSIQQQLDEINQQYLETSTYFKKQYGTEKFIIYFQSFSNTYAPIKTLKQLYLKALSYEDVIGLSIGTRADCIDDEILIFLKELSIKYEIWLEFGVQSIKDSTLNSINRAESFEDIRNTIIKTKTHNINLCVHLIFGFENETQEDMLNSVKEMISLNVDSIKIHPLYVVKNTALAAKVYNQTIKLISKERYINAVVESIKLLPQNISIQRITAGIDDDTLLAPMWCKNKNTLINEIRNELLKNNIIL